MSVLHRGAAVRRLPDRLALALLTSIVVTVLVGSSAPTPLYPHYQRAWHLSPISTTVAFSAYALAVLAALLVLGRLSDHLGRRPVAAAALGIQLVVTVLFATADGLASLIAARTLQGASVGMATAALGAALLDVDRVRGTLANALAPTIGTGSGALLSGLVAQWLPAPGRLIFFLLLALYLVQLAGLAAVRETAPRSSGALRSLRPEVALPRDARSALAVAAPVLFAVWALAGLYGALAPAFLHQVLNTDAPAIGGIALGLQATVAVSCILGLRALAPAKTMDIGMVALVVTGGLTVAAAAAGSATLFLAGAAAGGVAFGSGFQGAVRTVAQAADGPQRAGALSLLYVISYLGLGVPTIVAGVLVVYGGGLTDTIGEYGAAIGLLGLVGLILHRTTSAT